MDNVKIMEFPDNNPLTDDEESVLRLYLTLNLHEQIKKILKLYAINDDTISFCSEGLSFPRIIYFDKTRKLTSSTNPDKIGFELKNAVDKKNFKEFLEKSDIKEDPTNVEGVQFLNNFYSNNFDLIKQEFKTCKYLQYFIPLAIFNVYSSTGHQNLLLFNKVDKRVTWIEPQYNSNISERYKKLVEDVIVKILKFLEINPSEYTIDSPTKECPQSITMDKNCMFWTLLLTITLIDNPKSTIDEVSSAILKKYPTKEVLSKYIENFKVILNGTVGGKRHTRRRKGNRKTIRRKRRST